MHRCQRLFYIKVEDYDADGMIDDNSDEPDNTPTVSLHALTSLWSIHANETMQLRVTIDSTDFIALLDSVSTHNFISESMVS